MKLVRLACLLLPFLVSVGVVEAEGQKLNRIFGNTEGAFVLYDLRSHAMLGFTAPNFFQVTLMYASQIPIRTLGLLIYRVN